MDGTIVTSFLDTLNDVAGGGVNCFAGHCDWRIPNVKELTSIVNYERPYPDPAVEVAFDTGCVTGCSVTSCSCTQPAPYWSSTSLQLLAGAAWYLQFANGPVSYTVKSFDLYARAVRGGV